MKKGGGVAASLPRHVRCQMAGSTRRYGRFPLLHSLNRNSVNHSIVLKDPSPGRGARAPQGDSRFQMAKEKGRRVMRSAHNSALPGLSLREMVPIDRDASRQRAGSTRRYRKSADPNRGGRPCQFRNSCLWRGLQRQSRRPSGRFCGPA